MKLEVGMYVRTKYGYIDKIILVDYAEEKKQKYPNHPSKNHWRDKMLLSKLGYWMTSQNIVKVSFNIIDLVQVGDYVNGREVRNIFKMNNDILLYFKNDYSRHYDKTYKIKSIVTKEQFEQMKYEVE